MPICDAMQHPALECWQKRRSILCSARSKSTRTIVPMASKIERATSSGSPTSDTSPS